MNRFYRLNLFFVVLMLAVPALRAQQQQPPNDTQSGPTQPLPPLPPEGTNTNGSNSAAVPAGSGLLGGLTSTPENAQAIPDNHSLSDSEAFGLGQIQGPHNIFSPSLYFSEGVDTGFISSTTSWFTTVGGTLALDRFWRRYDFNLAYAGGESFYRPNGAFDYPYHNLSIAQTITWQRATLHLADAFSYSPQGTFGGLALGGPGMLGFQLPTELEPSASPNQTILTNFAQRLQEAVAGDLDLQLTTRSTLTFSGSWGLLHFVTPGYIDNSFLSARIGYNYSLNPKDSVGITYVYTEERYSGFDNFIRGHSIQASYGRKITGKLAFQVGAGPQYMDLLFFAPSPSLAQWSWSAFSALSYHWLRTDLNVTYAHVLSSGSGIFLGSIADSVFGTVSHRFTRNWSGAVTGGYSINNNLFSTPGLIDRFDLATAGANFTRQLGQSFNVALGYGVWYQAAAAGSCPVATCGPLNLVTNMATVTVRWNLIPIRFE